MYVSRRYELLISRVGKISGSYNAVPARVDFNGFSAGQMPASKRERRGRCRQDMNIASAIGQWTVKKHPPFMTEKAGIFFIPHEIIRLYFFFFDAGLDAFSISALNSVLIDPIFVMPAFALSSASG